MKEKKLNVKKWLKDPYNVLLILLLIFSFSIRLYYFILTKNQPLWWDEAEYMASAKSYAGFVDFKLGGQRLPGFPLIASLFFRLGITNETVLRFFLNFIPSLIVLFLVYLCLKEMYEDRRIAIISLLIVSVLWEHLFYSNRFHTENWGLIFELLAILIFFKYYLKQNLEKKKQFFILLSVFLLSTFSVFFRPGNVLFIPAFILFLPLLYFSIYKNNKKARYFVISFFLISFFLILFFIININKFHLIASYYHPENKLAWNVLGVFYGFYQSVIPKIPSIFFYTFLLGILLFFYEFYLYFPKIKKFYRDKKYIYFKSDIFNFLLLISVLISFIFFIRPYESYEYRWFFPFLPAMLSFTSKGIISFSDFVAGYSKNKKVVTTFLILIIVFLGCSNQLVHANKIIRIKLNSYEPVKDAGLWIKENSDKNDIIFSISQPQTAYYSERKVISYSHVKNSTDMDKFILKYKPRYIMASIFELHPSFILQRGTARTKTGENIFYIILPYFNSSIYYTTTGKIIQTDIKKEINKSKFSFKYVYPYKINGMFVYEIYYENLNYSSYDS